MQLDLLIENQCMSCSTLISSNSIENWLDTQEMMALFQQL